MTDGGAGAAEERFRAALEAMIDNVAIARSIRDASGTIVDFEMQYVNRPSIDGAGRTESDLVGHRVCDLYPQWRESGMFDRFAAVVETGEPYIGERLRYDDLLPDGRVIEGYWHLQIARLDDGYIAASRDVTALVLDERTALEAAAAAERGRLIMDVLQRAALPTVLPETPGAAVGVHHQPANTASPIGGDWYDVLLLADGRVAVVIADVAGHGPEIAAYTVQVRHILRTLVSDGEPDPGPILERANRVILGLQPDSAPFVTCCLAVFDQRDTSFRWALAGHLPPIVHALDGRTHAGGSPGPPLGVEASGRYATSTATLTSGDRVVLYTDGLIERRGSDLGLDIARLRGALGDLEGMPPADAARRLALDLDPGLDDVAVLILDVL